MKRKLLFAIATHSFVDIITNSSTEMFACDGSKSIEFIKELLNYYVSPNSYEDPWIFHIEDYRKYRKECEEAHRKYEEIFDKTGVWDDNVVKRFWNDPIGDIEGYFIDEECEEDLEKIRRFHLRYRSHKDYFENFRKINEEDLNKLHLDEYDLWREVGIRTDREEKRFYKELSELPDNEKPEWWNDISLLRRHYKSVKELEGKIIIMSSDSFIFYFEEYEKLKKALNATKYHLG